jgi:ABC-type sugar transport system ATPase subunit
LHHGLTVADSGSVTLQGKLLPIGLPKATINAGMSLVTEDRKDSGLVLSSSILSNITVGLQAPVELVTDQRTQGNPTGPGHGQAPADQDHLPGTAGGLHERR